MELTRWYGVPRAVLLSEGRSLGIGRLHAMCGSSNFVSKNRQVVSQSLPLPPPTLHDNWQLRLAITLVDTILFPLLSESVTLQV